MICTELKELGALVSLEEEQQQQQDQLQQEFQQQQQSEELVNTAEPGKCGASSASPSNACTLIDVILDFKTLDQDRNGEISAVEFIDGLRSNRQLASKFGLSDDILKENGTREKYELTFGSIDYNHSETVNVIHFISRTVAHPV